MRELPPPFSTIFARTVSNGSWRLVFYTSLVSLTVFLANSQDCVFKMAYNYGKTFKKDGKLVRYRYTDKKKSTKKLVAVSKKKKNTRRKK
ncbi:MAG: hypothetical protein [Circular genetic element sp.]|nr:MAG: hypothetical protein [Circular genetic element sp.]